MKIEQIKLLPTTSLDFICNNGRTNQIRTAALKELLNRPNVTPTQLLKVLYCNIIGNAGTLLPRVTDVLIAHPDTSKEDLLLASENSYSQEACLKALKHLLELGTTPDFLDNNSSSIYELSNEQLINRYKLIGEYNGMNIYKLIAQLLSTKSAEERSILSDEIISHPDITVNHLELVSVYNDYDMVKYSFVGAIIDHKDVDFSHLSFILSTKIYSTAIKKKALVKLSRLADVTPNQLISILSDFYDDDHKVLYETCFLWLLNHPDTTFQDISTALKKINIDMSNVIEKNPPLKLILELTN